MVVVVRTLQGSARHLLRAAQRRVRRDLVQRSREVMVLVWSALHGVASGATWCSGVEWVDYRNRAAAGTISFARASGGIGRRAGFRFL